MTLFVVPYHQAERLPSAHIPLPSGASAVTVTPRSTDGDLWQRLASLYDTLAAWVAKDVSDGIVPVVVSGDCLVSLGVVTGVQRAGVDPSIIWFDAHGDVHTVESSGSGYLGGMSLRLVLGGNYDLIGEQLGLRPLAEEKAVLVDARELDPAEAEYLASSQVRRYPVDKVEIPDGPLILHVDVDIIDASELPGLLFPVPAGPSTSAVLDTIRRIIAEGDVIALDIALPWHPSPEHHEIRARLVAELIATP
jgi:arginase